MDIQGVSSLVTRSAHCPRTRCSHRDLSLLRREVNFPSILRGRLLLRALFPILLILLCFTPNILHRRLCLSSCHPQCRLTYHSCAYYKHTALSTAATPISFPLSSFGFVPSIYLNYPRHASLSWSSAIFRFAKPISYVLSFIRPTLLCNKKVKQSVPSLQNPENPNEVEKLAKMDKGVWLRAEWGPRYPPQAFWLETAFITPPSTTEFQGPGGSSSTMGNVPRSKRLGPLLIDFFQFVHFIYLCPLLTNGATVFGPNGIRPISSSARNNLCLYARALPYPVSDAREV